MILFSSSFVPVTRRRIERLIDECYSKPTFRALVAVPTFQHATAVLDELERNFRAKNVASARIMRHLGLVEFNNGSKLHVIPLIGPRGAVYLRVCSMEFDDVMTHDAYNIHDYVEVSSAIQIRKRPRSPEFFEKAQFWRRHVAGGWAPPPTTEAIKQYYDPRQSDGRIVRPPEHSGWTQAQNALLYERTFTEKKPMPETLDKDVLKRNKFYVGSPKALTSNWGKPTLADATKHAEERLEATGEAQFIVKIVRVVRRKKPPVVVEDVR